MIPDPATPVDAATEAWPRGAAQRFMSKIRKTDGCWEWTASRNAKGYGKFTDYGRHYAHRYAYELFVGPIPDGMTIDHLCWNKGCVNPAHLEPVTREENTRRAAPRVTYFTKAGRSTCTNGHPWTDENTSVRADSRTRRCKKCAADYMRRRRASA